MKKFFLSMVLLGAVAFTPLIGLGQDDQKQPKDQPAKVEKGDKHKFKLPNMSKEQVAMYLQDISVTIRAGNSEGSGVITNVDGVNYVLTCGHVVAGLRHTRQIIENGSTKTVVEFDDAEVVKVLVEDGRTVGSMRFFAEVLRYSDADNGEDLALLRVRKKDLCKTRVGFYNDTKIPALGTSLYHVGSLLGQAGSNSMTRGIMSQHGRVFNGTVYDQTTCAAFPGSSGGGVYLEDGRYCAMIVRGAGETFNLVVPMRRITGWAKRVGVEFVICPDCAIPDEATLRKMPIEENSVRGVNRPTAYPKNSKGEPQFNFLINEIESPRLMPRAER